MYLPQASIDAWKEKIIEHPIILSQQEIALLIANNENSRQHNLNTRLNTLLDGDGFDPDKLLSLLNAGAEINAVANGYKVLHILIDCNHNRQFDALIETLVKTHHANINMKNPVNSRTPLHALISKQPNASVEFIIWLVSLGASIHTQDKDGQTLLQAAVHAKNDAVIQYLKNLAHSQPQARTPVEPAMGPPSTDNQGGSVDRGSWCSISMHVLSGFMVVLGISAIAIAFTLLNAAALNIAGVTVACLGLATLLTGYGLFKESYVSRHTGSQSRPLLGPSI